MASKLEELSRRFVEGRIGSEDYRHEVIRICQDTPGPASTQVMSTINQYHYTELLTMASAIISPAKDGDKDPGEG